MLPGSHSVPINPAPIPSGQERLLLADAFSEFVSASSRLEESYQELQREVSFLGRELAERNITLKRSVAENERMRTAFQQIIESMPCGILVLDSMEKVVTINPEGRRLLGLSNSRVESLRDLSRLTQINFKLLETGSGDTMGSELCLSTRQGKRWLGVGSRRLSGPANQEISSTPELQTIWMFVDISASKQAGEEREAARNAMALAEVAGILAHEIRNPLASMELFAGLIMDDQQHASQWVSHLRAGIRHLSGTVNNVLSMHGGGTADLEAMELSACVRRGVDFAEPIAAEAGVTLSFEPEPRAINILGNESALHQVILNLVCNAIRHTPSGGTISITVRTTCRGEQMSAVAEVEDTGSGVPQHLIDRIFAAGFSASGDRPGLGLAVCKRIMSLHKGEIRVSKSSPAGTTFQLEFPLL